MTRRELLRRVAFAFPAYSAAVQLKAANTDPQVTAILARIKAPSFPNRDFDITKYGAAGDGTKRCTEAIKAAIHACTAAGGGRVIIPRGNFLTGAIHLENK